MIYPLLKVGYWNPLLLLHWGLFLSSVLLANKHMKRCSTSLIISEMQIKTSMRYHFTPDRMTIIKKSPNHNFWRGYGEKGTLLHCWWECKLIQPLWREWISQRDILNTKYNAALFTIDRYGSKLGWMDKKCNTYIHTYISIHVHTCM